jgi:sugar phosphate isomerase/epimerase
VTDWKVAIQVDMLPGPSLEDRFAQASDLGLQGVEFWSEGLPEQAAEIERLSGRGAVVASSINNGRRSRFLDPDPDERDRAMSELSEAIDIAGRIGAEGVVFVPHFFEPLLPDLSPYKSAVELECTIGG